jgi:type VI secretion system secreted protein Hcp
MGFQGYITIKGTKQGQFKGEKPGAAKGLIPILTLHNHISIPLDPTTGSSTGKLQHMPIMITKTWGAASPQFLEALFTNEVLSSVSMTFNQVGFDGKEATFFTIKLVNAVVCGFRQYVGSAPGLTDPANALEEISMTYQKIEVSNLPAGTSATGS